MDLTRQLLNLNNSIEPVEQLTEELEYESVAAVNQLLTEGRIGNYIPPFKAQGLWVSDRHGTSVLEVTRHDTARQVAAALNVFVNQTSEVKNIDEQKISEIDYSDFLDSSNFSEKRLINAAHEDGEIEGTPVMLVKSGKESAYFLLDNGKISAFVGFEGSYLKNVKNFTSTAGAIRALIGYLVHKKGKTLSILPNEPLTSDGFKWISHLIKNPRGLVIKDQNGKPVNTDELSSEWERAKKTGKPGKTSITISEDSDFGDKLRLNEEKRQKHSILMPHSFYGISAKMKQGVVEGRDNPLQDIDPRGWNLIQGDRPIAINFPDEYTAKSFHSGHGYGRETKILHGSQVRQNAYLKYNPGVINYPEYSKGVVEGRFDEPLSGYHIVYRKSGIPVHATPSFDTKEQAQKYLMTKMFRNHQDYKVAHTAEVGIAEEVNDLELLGDCRDEDLIADIFGSVTDFAKAVDEHGDEFTDGSLVVKYDPETDIHTFYKRHNMKEQFLIKELLQLRESADDRLTADHLYVGSPVEITGDVEFKGSTGEILSFGQDKKFVVVNLYNGGKHSFHSSDVRELEEDDFDEEDDESSDFYVVFHDEDEQDTWIGKLTQEGGKWRERTHKGKPDYRWGTSYMGYLSPDDVMSWIHKDYSRGMQIDGPFDSAQEAEQFAQHNYGRIGEMVESVSKTVSKSGDFSLTCSGDRFSLHHKSKKIATLDHSDWMDLVDAVKNRTTGSFDGYSIKQKADSYTLHDSTGKEIAYLSATDMDKLAADSKEYLSLTEDPAQAKKIKFKGRMEGKKTTISAEIPGEDRSYGVWDGDDNEGVVLSESLKHAENCDYRFGGTCDCGLEQGEDYED